MSNWRNPSKPERLRDPRPEPRYLKSDSGDAAKDGYSVIARRPRVRQHTEPVEVDRAEAIERAYGIGDDE
jgi:hypothetical protein